MQFLTEHISFPDPSEASEDGLLAYGGDLSTARLLHAYKHGIFPWFTIDEPILWWSPNPRMVLFPKALRISKSMKTILRKEVFTIRYNTAFKTVIEHCAHSKRNDQNDTWITPEMMQAYYNLHKEGVAISVEAWQGDKLVGGLYGIDLKAQKVFCGESMFSLVSNASKAAFITLVEHLKTLNYTLIDCQLHSNHLESLGAQEISRDDFLTYLKKA